MKRIVTAGPAWTGTLLFFFPNIIAHSHTSASFIHSLPLWLMGLMGLLIGGIWWWNRPAQPSPNPPATCDPELPPTSPDNEQADSIFLLSSFNQAIGLYLNECLPHLPQPEPSPIFTPETDIRQRGIQLMDLTKQIELVTRLARNELSINLQPVDLVSFLNQLFDTIYPLICTTRDQLVFRHELSQLLIHIDINFIERVFFNLLLFARPSLPPKGQIIIKLQMVAHRVHIGILLPHTVIPAQQIPNLFSALAPSVPDTNRPDFHTGIDLLVAQRLIQLHHGNLSVSSHPQEGTACWIELPMNAGVNTVASPFKLALIPLIITLLTKE